MIPLLTLLLISTALATAHPDAQEATVNSLIYGVPLPIFAATAISWATSNHTSEWKANTLVHRTDLSTAEDQIVVMPNVDTVYSFSVLDLSQGDVVAEMGYYEEGRFSSWSFYDMFSNNFDNCTLGTRYSDATGKYRITHRYANPGCERTPDGEYAGTVYVPTVYGLSLVRHQVNSQSDLEYIIANIQPHYTLTEIPREDDSAPTAPPLTAELLTEGIDSSDTALATMQLLARFARTNPPEMASEADAIGAMLALAGVDMANQTYATPSCVNLTLAQGTAAAAIAAVPDNSSDWIRPNADGAWVLPDPSFAGDFGAAYAERAVLCINGYLLMTSDQSMYPTYRAADPADELSFLSNETYLVEFSGKPPVNAFWSLTMYDSDGFLVDSGDALPEGRYSVNDRGNLTYPDGTLVYGDGADERDGTFYVLVQSTDVAIAPEWESNWLPSPAGNQSFSLTLRWYAPTDAFIDGSYVYPIITAVGANPPILSSC
ncbi:DUF1254-like protein [Mycena kentingensis (nom. inval.)]|nr:DUF1254-like protein [Mycena kentingensis (nom. inval.)]